MQPESSRADAINRRAWRTDEAVGRFGHDGWTDPGEQAATQRLAAEMAGKRILDLGVGSGRTVPLLTAISEDYVAVDYTPRLVEVCRARHPGRRIEHGDARDLSIFADGSFDLVVFSNNGIDAVDMEGRAKIVAEVRRVLKPGGVFLFSTHNQAGPGHDEKPWDWFEFTANPLRLASRTLALGRTLLRDLPNYLRYRRLNRRHEGHSTMVASAHHFGIVIVYMDLAAQRRLLDEAGFAVEAVFGNEAAQELPPGQDTSPIWWFHLLARKRG